MGTPKLDKSTYSYCDTKNASVGVSLIRATEFSKKKEIRTKCGTRLQYQQTDHLTNKEIQCIPRKTDNQDAFKKTKPTSFCNIIKWTVLLADRM